MNREGRRALNKKLQNKKAHIRAVNIFKNLSDKSGDKIYDGDLVTLNVEQIMSRKEYDWMQMEYKQFVESNRNKVFVAHPHHARYDGFSAIIELDGVDWTFWYGDLIRVENKTKEGE